MTKRMLIDARSAEETRVAVMDGHRIEDFDVETESRRQLKGNIYLAKVVRVEPSLQAAFVEYGGNRHGFLAFGEIHPDYYQIPVADRQRLIALQEEEARLEEEAFAAAHDEALAPPASGIEPESQPDNDRGENGQDEIAPRGADAAETENNDAVDRAAIDTAFPDAQPADAAPPDTLGGENSTSEELRERSPTPRFLRNYKIQEVIRRRQVLLVQVVKEERGTKGAALTTYISLAGRFCVLMPNSPRGGGISRKITSAADRRRLKEITAELDMPRGMGLIVRTAGASRPKPEIRRDCEYLLRLWDDIRARTLQSIAPTIVYEEASLIKRALRDVYSGDFEDIVVDGESAWKAARDFMRMIMPTHVKKIQLWRDPAMPLFARQQVDAQIEAMLQPTVQLRSGGYIVINQTEALVAIDVNSGKSTRERGIEETALRTNLEAAEEIARQLRLRDLAGLIVIDFIDMESKRNNAAVERRIKDALKSDRARIQVGYISHFGLLELSRQRLRPSITETSFALCSHCGGTGQVRSTESASAQIIRAIEDEGARRKASEILVHVSPELVLYMLNHRRSRVAEIESRFAMRVSFASDAALHSSQCRIERLRLAAATPFVPQESEKLSADRDDGAEAQVQFASTDQQPDAPGQDDASETEVAKRRRRRRRRSVPNAETPFVAAAQLSPNGVGPAGEPMPVDFVGDTGAEAATMPDAVKRNRSRRGGRGRQRTQENRHMTEASAPSYAGPTPADPFANSPFDLADVFERAETNFQPEIAPPSSTTLVDFVAETWELDGVIEASMPSDQHADEPSPQPDPAQPVVEAAVEAPVIQPIIIDDAKSSPKPRQGWWRKR